MAHNTDGAEPAGDMMGLTSGYITRAARELPRQGTRYPWQVYQSYVRDYRALKRSDVEDGVLTCSLHDWKWDLASGRCLTTTGHPIRSTPSGLAKEKAAEVAAG